MGGQIRLVMIGDELLDGRSHESNSHWLIERLSAVGLVVVGSEIVSDGVDEIVAALRRAVEDSRLVVVSGGLGPTIDDRSRDALAVLIGGELIEDPEALAEIRRRFESRGRTMPETNIRQAQRPPTAEMLANPIGTAPGIWQEYEGSVLALLPGVPAELRRMFQEQLMPRLDALELERRPAQCRLRAARAGESAMAQWVEAALEREGLAHVSRAYCVQRDGLDIILRARDATPEAAQELHRASDCVEIALLPRVYARGDGDLSSLVLARLERAGQTLAVAESCTAGMLGGRIADTAGSSKVFLGGVIAYSNQLKQTLLDLSESLLREHGAVSEPSARGMAEGVRACVGSDHALAVTGIAGPDGGSAEKPVGTIWIACASPDQTLTRRLQLPGDRQQNRQWAVAAALDLLREALGDGRMDL